MKRYAALLLAVAMMVPFSGCVGKDQGDKKDDNLNNNVNYEDVISQPVVKRSDEYIKITGLLDKVAEPIDEPASTLDYINNNRESYDEIVAMDTEALKILFELFEQEDQSMLICSIMENACMDILGDEYVYYDSDTPQEWYENFRNNILYTANLNSEEFTAEKYPKSSCILSVLSYGKKIYKTSEYLKDEEMSTSDGIRLAMTYDEVMSVLGEEGASVSGGSSRTKTVTKDGVVYTFNIVDDKTSYDAGIQHDGQYYLFKIAISNDSVSAPRDIKTGDKIGYVFTKFPTKDVKLKKWAEQTIYGVQSAGNPRAYMTYEVSSASYTVFATTSNQTLRISFDKNNTVNSIEYILERI